MTKQFRLTVKGQVTIPKDVRELLGVKPGDAVAFDTQDGQVSLRKADVPEIDRKAAVVDFRDRLKRALERCQPLPMDMSTDEYMAMIREPAVPPFDRG